MDKVIYCNSPDSFESIYEFVDCLNCGGEIEFHWNGKAYSLTPVNGGFVISLAVDPETSQYYESTDQLLEHLLDGEKLRSLVTRLEIDARTL